MIFHVFQQPLELWKKYVKVTRIHQKNQLLHVTAQANLYKSTKHVTDAKITGCHLCFKDDLPTWMTKSSALPIWDKKHLEESEKTFAA
jgi:hypothetical protein